MAQRVKNYGSCKNTMESSAVVYLVQKGLLGMKSFQEYISKVNNYARQNLVLEYMSKLRTSKLRLI